MGVKTENGFTEYRHLHCKEIHEVRALTFRFDVNQDAGTIHFSWASCSELDNFSRAKGREIADENLFNSAINIDSYYDRNYSLVDNALRAMGEIVSAYESDETFREEVNKDEPTKKSYQEILRALDIATEVQALNSIFNADPEELPANITLFSDIADNQEGC